MKKPRKPPTRTPAAKSHRGKQHPLHAESLDHLADAMDGLKYFALAAMFRAEARRVRKILR